jgi:hypothetical protein
MTQAQTKATEASVDEYLASRASHEQLVDCKALMAMFERVTKHSAKMWGPGIVGYGSYRYTYASGRTGESCLAGLAIRGRDLVVYLVAAGPHHEALLATLGRHRLGKACLYFRRLADLDERVLEQLVAEAVAELGRRHDAQGGV